MGSTTSTQQTYDILRWKEKQTLSRDAFLRVEKDAQKRYAGYNDRMTTEKCVASVLKMIEDKEKQLSSCQKQIGEVNLNDMTPEGKELFEKQRPFFPLIIELKNELESLHSQLVLHK